MSSRLRAHKPLFTIFAILLLLFLPGYRFGSAQIRFAQIRFAQIQGYGSASALSIPESARMQPATLAHMLTSSAKPLLLQVGSHTLFVEAHIPGSQYAGPGSQPEGLASLRHAVASYPRKKLIVLYCGCCPWTHCPNVGPAYRQLIAMGFTNVKVLYLPNNFGTDWVSRGYPVE